MLKPIREALDRVDLWRLSIAVILLALSIRILACFSTESDWDVYAFALVARDILSGKLPFSGIFDNKPVGLNYVFAAFEYVFGSNVFAMQLVALCAASVTAVIIYRTCRTLAGNNDATFPMAMAAVYLALSVKNGGVSSMSELVANPFLAATINLALRWRLKLMPYRTALFLIGITCGLACQITYLLVPAFALTGLICAYAVATDAIPASTKAAGLLTGTLGFIIGFGVILIPQAISGDLGNYFLMQIRYHMVYRKDIDPWTAATNILISAQILFPFVPLFVALAKGGLQPGEARSRSFAVILIGLLLGTILSISIPNRFPAHYFLLVLPGLVVLGAFFMQRLPTSRQHFVLLSALVISALLTTRPAIRAVDALSKVSFDDRIATYIRAHTGDSDRIFIFCGSHVPYYISNRVAASRYVFSIHYLEEKIAAHFVDARSVFFGAMHENPALVVLGPCNVDFDVRSELATRNYRLTTTIQEDHQLVSIFERR